MNFNLRKDLSLKAKGFIDSLTIIPRERKNIQIRIKKYFKDGRQLLVTAFNELVEKVIQLFIKTELMGV